MARMSSQSVEFVTTAGSGGSVGSSMKASDSKFQASTAGPHWSQIPAKGILSTSLSRDLEQPPTPLRANSGSCLTMQYSDADVPDPELLAVNVVSLQPVTVPVSCSSTLLVKQQQEQQPRAVQLSAGSQAAAVVVASLAWVLVSSATILINKRIMVDLSFPFPAAVSALGMLGTTVGSFLVCCVLGLVPCRAKVTAYFFFTRIMTTGFLIALSFHAGNTAYLFLSVAFVQMLKAFTPVSTMVAGFFFGLEQPSAKLMAAVGCISAGVLVSSYGELNFSMFGVAAMMTSIAAEGLRTALMQHLLASKQFHPLEAWLYLGPACLVWLTILVGASEAQQIQDQQALSILAAHPWHCAFAALAGFVVNSLAMLVIQLASALTLKVLGVCKDVGLVAFGVLLLGEHIAALQVGGYALALCGFTAYNVVKLTGAAAPQAVFSGLGLSQKHAAKSTASGKAGSLKGCGQTRGSRLDHSCSGNARADGTPACLGQASQGSSSSGSRSRLSQQHSGLIAVYCSVVLGETSNSSLRSSSLTEPLLVPTLHP